MILIMSWKPQRNSTVLALCRHLTVSVVSLYGQAKHFALAKMLRNKKGVRIVAYDNK